MTQEQVDKLGYNNSTTQQLNNSTGFMIQCPDCRAKIPDDSAFCDQCGVELYWCPECKRPKLRRGHDCPLCGSDLVPGRQYLVSQQSSNQAIKQSGNQAIKQSGIVSGRQRLDSTIARGTVRAYLRHLSRIRIVQVHIRKPWQVHTLRLWMVGRRQRLDQRHLRQRNGTDSRSCRAAPCGR